MKKIQVIGNVCKDAEVHTIAPERSAVNFTVAVNERYKDKQGVKQEKVSFIKCVIWCKMPSIAQYIKKGMKIYVEGSPEAEAYVGNDGKVVANVKIIARDIQFISSAKQTTAPSASTDSESDLLSPTPDDDLPF